MHGDDDVSIENTFGRLGEACPRSGTRARGLRGRQSGPSAAACTRHARAPERRATPSSGGPRWKPRPRRASVTSSRSSLWGWRFISC